VMIIASTKQIGPIGIFAQSSAGHRGARDQGRFLFGRGGDQGCSRRIPVRRRAISPSTLAFGGSGDAGRRARR